MILRLCRRFGQRGSRGQSGLESQFGLRAGHGLNVFICSPHSKDQCRRGSETPDHDFPSKAEDWQVRVTVHGIAGLPLVAAESITHMSPVVGTGENVSTEEETGYAPSQTKSSLGWQPSASNATLTCTWDFVVQVPIRWRDLPRDALLLFEVTGKCDVTVSN